MKLKISIFSFFISLLLTFSYSTYGDKNCKNICLTGLESSPYKEKFAKNENSFIVEIESAFEAARVNHFQKVEVSSNAASNIKFRFYEQEKNSGKFIRQGEFEESAEEADTEKGNPVFDVFFDLSDISNRKDLVNRVKYWLEKDLSTPDN